jgi:hypothetical protein
MASFEESKAAVKVRLAIVEAIGEKQLTIKQISAATGYKVSQLRFGMEVLKEGKYLKKCGSKLGMNNNEEFIYELTTKKYQPGEVTQRPIRRGRKPIEQDLPSYVRRISADDHHPKKHKDDKPKSLSAWTGYSPIYSI